jgi:hypothetical protein
VPANFSFFDMYFSALSGADEINNQLTKRIMKRITKRCPPIIQSPFFLGGASLLGWDL